MLECLALLLHRRIIVVDVLTCNGEKQKYGSDSLVSYSPLILLRLIHQHGPVSRIAINRKAQFERMRGLFYLSWERKTADWEEEISTMISDLSAGASVMRRVVATTLKGRDRGR